MLEHYTREDLKAKVPVVMSVLRPLKVVITNYPENEKELLEIENNSENESLGKRLVTFSRNLFIESEDFMEVPMKGFHRLYPGNEVRLKGGYFIKCDEVVKDDVTGAVIELHCSYDPTTKSGNSQNTRKVKGTIHWIEANSTIKADVHLYEKLVRDEELLKDSSLSWDQKIDPGSLIVLKDCLIEKQLAGIDPGTKLQFIRNGYFTVDTKYTTDEKLVFNRIVPLKDTWKKKQA